MLAVATPALRARSARVCWLMLGALAALVLSANAAHAQGASLLPVPALTGRVIDQAQVLGAGAEKLTQHLAQIEQTRGSQVVILTVKSTGIEPIEDFANRVANAWKIGRKGVGDGVLLLLASEDRKIRVEVARNLEGAIPDVTAKRLIREVLAPAFKVGDFVGGFDAALNRIDERLSAESLPAPTAPSTSSHRESLGDTLPLVIIGGFMAAMFLRSIIGSLGSVVGAAGAGAASYVLMSHPVLIAVLAGAGVLLLATIFGSARAGRAYSRRGDWSAPQGWGSGFPSTGGFGGHTSGGFGGGGFSSGGGGDFGGGGASGDF